MADPVIDTFRQEFDRFHNLLLQQIDACPSEEVWLSKTGAIAFWQHLMHAFAIVELYALPSGTHHRQTVYSQDEVRFKKEPHRALSRDETKALGESMKQLAYEFFETQSSATLNERNESMSLGMGKDCTNIQALIGLIRHYNYHLGCLDSVLRSHGIPGVY